MAVWENLTTSQILISVGLIFDIGGIAALTLSGVFAERPFRRLYNLYFNTDRENLEEGNPRSATDFESETVFAGYDPDTKGGYDKLKKRLSRLAIGSVSLIVGLFLQLIGTLIT